MLIVDVPSHCLQPVRSLVHRSVLPRGLLPRKVLAHAVEHELLPLGFFLEDCKRLMHSGAQFHRGIACELKASSFPVFGFHCSTVSSRPPVARTTGTVP